MDCTAERRELHKPSSYFYFKMDFKELEKRLKEKLEKKYVLKYRKCPPSKLLLTLGSRLQFTHHGLDEFFFNLFEMYPFLDLSELLALSYSLYKKRKDHFRGFRRSENFYGMVRVYDYEFENEIRNSKLNKILYKFLTDGERSFQTAQDNEPDIYFDIYFEFADYNPYCTEKCKLEERIEAFCNVIGQEGEKKFKEKILEEPATYVFPCQYEREKRARGGDNYKLEIMKFMPVYPKKGKKWHREKFAMETARIIRKFPSFFIEPRSFSPQLSLFIDKL